MSFYRRPRTANEKRQSQNCKYSRAKRRPKNLPCNWDDIEAKDQRSWKKHRKTQYKPVESKEKKKSKSFYSPQVHTNSIRCTCLVYYSELGGIVKEFWYWNKRQVY